MQLLAYPFRLTSTGSPATVAQGSDADLSQQVACLLLTRVGERKLAPGFGLNDLNERGISPTEIRAQVTARIPGIRAVDVAVDGTHLDGGQQNITVQWERTA